MEDAEEVPKKYLKTKKQMKEAQRGKSGFELAKYPHPVATPSSLSRESRQSAGLQIVSKVVTAAEFIEVRMKRNLLDDLKTIVKPAPDQETYVDAEDMLDRLAKIYFKGKQLDRKERRSLETAIGITVQKSFKNVEKKRRGLRVCRRPVYVGLQFVEKE